MRNHSRIRRLVIAVVAVGVLATAPTASAHHSVPSPKWFWDPDNNGVPGPEPKVTPAGGFWESVRLARLDAALAEWRNGHHLRPDASLGRVPKRLR